jgi:energy-coupling factor transport system ATP-binding protein
MNGDYIIDIHGLKFAYPPYAEDVMSENVLNGVDVRVKRGEFVSIMGATGAGKTTLCLALNGIVPHSTGGSFGGNVLVCGLNTKRAAVSDLAQKVGIVFQDSESQLFCMSVADEVAFGLENLGVPSAEMRERMAAALEMTGMAGFAERSPFHLSGGQKQRVAIASILAMEPEILVLDEPTSGLDPAGKEEVFRVVDRLRREKDMTIIMAGHECEQIAEFSDRVLVLDGGRVALEGAPREVFAEAARLREIGVAIPQMAELAAGLHERGALCRFITLAEAERYFAHGS